MLAKSQTRKPWVKAAGAAMLCGRRIRAATRGEFDRSATKIPPPAQDEPVGATHSETAVFAGGCFWGVQGVFEHVRGVTQVVSGYTGGAANTAHYEVVSEGDTGHAESVQVTSILRRSPMAACCRCSSRSRTIRPS